jgi:hypothetical protein
MDSWRNFRVGTVNLKTRIEPAISTGKITLLCSFFVLRRNFIGSRGTQNTYSAGNVCELEALQKKSNKSNFRSEVGAGEEIRTLDIFLGKEVLYQLSYARINEAQTIIAFIDFLQGDFSKNIILRVKFYAHTSN